MARRIADDRGALYVEALIAAAILAIALIPLIGVFSLTPKAQQDSARQITALNLARQELEALHARGPAAAGGGYQETVELNGVTYTVDVKVAPWEEPEGEEEEPLLYDITATVTWTDASGGIHQVTLASAVARRP